MSARNSCKHLIASGLAIIVTSFAFQAKAQKSCQFVHSKSSVYRDVYRPFKELDNKTADLIEILTERPHELGVADLKRQVAKLDELTEAYFKAAGIRFHKIGTITPLRNLKDASVYNLVHSIYSISGTRTGDEVSRMIYGVQANPNLKESQLKVVFNSLYQLKNMNWAGHFSAESNTIFMGPHVLGLDAASLSSTLRHEIQHYFEQMKLNRGEMTLARFQFKESSPKEEKDLDSYAKFLRLDELDAHLRDLRALMNENQISSRDGKLATALKSEEKMQRIQSVRPAFRDSKANLLGKLIQASKQTTEEIEKLALSISLDKMTVNEKTGGVQISFVGVPGQFSVVKVDLLGLLPVGSHLGDKELFRDQLLETISWSRQRIATIEKEYLSLISSLPKSN